MMAPRHEGHRSLSMYLTARFIRPKASLGAAPHGFVVGNPVLVRPLIVPSSWWVSSAAWIIYISDTFFPSISVVASFCSPSFIHLSRMPGRQTLQHHTDISSPTYTLSSFPKSSFSHPMTQSLTLLF